MFKTRSVPSLPSKVSGCATDWPASGTVHVTVQVRQPGHVPQGLVLRSRVDDLLFTADMDASHLQQVATDPLLVSLAAASRVLPAGPTPQPMPKPKPGRKPAQ
jgi:hypothetical protein